MLDLYALYYFRPFDADADNPAPYHLDRVVSLCSADRPAPTHGMWWLAAMSGPLDDQAAAERWADNYEQQCRNMAAEPSPPFVIHGKPDRAAKVNRNGGAAAEHQLDQAYRDAANARREATELRALLATRVELAKVQDRIIAQLTQQGATITDQLDEADASPTSPEDAETNRRRLHDLKQLLLPLAPPDTSFSSYLLRGRAIIELLRRVATTHIQPGHADRDAALALLGDE